MFKYKYAINYKCRPNKKTLGSECVLNVVTSDKLEKQGEQRKVLLMLAKVHRVNVDAIELGGFTLLGREFVPLKWLGDKAKGIFKRSLARVR